MKLAIPELKPVKNNDFPKKVKKINAWLEEVKKLDAGEQIKSFYKLLLKVNRGKIAPKEHIEILEAFRPMAYSCVEQLHKRYMTMKLPLSDKALPIYKLALTITDEMALGYKLALIDLTTKSSLFSGSWILMAFNRAMFYQCQILLRYSEIYINPAVSVWQDLNALYLKSLELKIHHKKLVDPFVENTKLCVEEYFKKACLFSISNPYSLRKGESRKLFDKIDLWQNHFYIKEDITKKDKNYFIIDISSRVEPEMVDKTRLSKKLLRYIVLDDLKAFMAKIIEEERDTEIQLIQGEKLNVTAMKRLQKNWTKRDNLRFNRKKSDIKIIVEVGIKNINDQMTEDLVAADDPFADVDESAEFDFDALSGSPEVKEEYQLLKSEKDNSEQEVVWRLTEEGNILSDEHEKDVAINRQEREEKRRMSSGDSWQVLNVSDSGYSLRWQGKNKPSAHVGEVIGLRLQEKISADWHIAVIRWIQYKGESSFDVGIESISKLVIIAKAWRAEGVQQSNALKSCLFIPKIDAVKQPYTIIVPSFMYRVGEELILSYNGIKQGVLIEQMYDHTGSYTQFAIKPIKLKSDKEEEQQEDENTDEFNTLWDEL